MKTTFQCDRWPGIRVDFDVEFRDSPLEVLSAMAAGVKVVVAVEGGPSAFAWFDLRDNKRPSFRTALECRLHADPLAWVDLHHHCRELVDGMHAAREIGGEA